MSITKNVLLKWYCFNEKKIKNDSDHFLTLKIDFECQNFAIFDKAVDNVGRSDDDMI